MKRHSVLNMYTLSWIDLHAALTSITLSDSYSDGEGLLLHAALMCGTV